MFEDSLVVSQVRHTSLSERWITLASMGLQLLLAALVITLPLLHPEKLALHMNAPHLLVPLPPKPPVPIEHVQSSSSSTMATPIMAQTPTRSSLFHNPLSQIDDAPSLSLVGQGMTDGNPMSLGIGDTTDTPRIAVVSTKTSNAPVRVSSGVSSGMLLTPIHPVYPSIARMTRVEGTVIVEATISRTGTIKSLHVVSGPVMLQQAALDAIRMARYQPYRLNGSPTEVQTTITVNFRLGS